MLNIFLSKPTLIPKPTKLQLRFFQFLVLFALASFNVMFLVRMGGPSTLLESTMSVPPKTKDLITSEKAKNENSTTTITPLFPLPDVIQYSHRPVNHLEKMHNVSISPWMLPPLNLFFLQDQKNEMIYRFHNYLDGFEGAVTHTWLSILHKLPNRVKDYIIIDGGMNIGFYTTISAVSGYQVHSFEIQLDCFDIANVLLRGNRVKDRVSFYHLGLWSDVSSLKDVMEGCDPGRNINNFKLDNFKQMKMQNLKLSWRPRTHTVSTITLDNLLETASEHVAILKMDIEGAEISALKGISNRHLARIENILLECAMRRIVRLKTSRKTTIGKFIRLQEVGFRAYLLYQQSIPLTEMWNPEYLETIGIRNTPGSLHPLLNKIVTNTTKSFTNLIHWEVVSWEKLLDNGCRKGCNLWFSRMMVE